MEKSKHFMRYFFFFGIFFPPKKKNYDKFEKKKKNILQCKFLLCLLLKLCST